jgi:hypothetical protein
MSRQWPDVLPRLRPDEPFQVRVEMFGIHDCVKSYYIIHVPIDFSGFNEW